MISGNFSFTILELIPYDMKISFPINIYKHKNLLSLYYTKRSAIIMLKFHGAESVGGI